VFNTVPSIRFITRGEPRDGTSVLSQRPLGAEIIAVRRCKETICSNVGHYRSQEVLNADY
jgi:hypothetical protein